MSNLSAGAIKLNGLNPKQSIETPNQSTNIQLKGINWDKQVNTQNPNWKNDRTNVTTQNYGTVPSSDDLPPMFSNDTPVTNPSSSNNKSVKISDPNLNSAKDEGMTTGIGMAIGAVGGALIGSRFGSTKIGIGIGLLVGGFTGHFFEK